MAIRNNLIFGGVSARKYGVYISGDGVYNAPTRDIETVTIPGRNGALTIDHGRYENIEVEYPAFCIASSQAEFRKKIAAFRNAIVSQTGYQRIEDTYHPEEYRLGVYYEGLEAEPKMYGSVAEFTLKFNCKPQRYLKSGEESLAVTSGGKVINPTEHSSEPLLIIDGYGDINIGDYDITVNDVLVGDLSISDKVTVQNATLSKSFTINESSYNTGDIITINGMTMSHTITIPSSLSYLATSGDRTMGIEYWNTVDSDATLSYSVSGKTAKYGITIPTMQISIGSSFSKTYKTRRTCNVQDSSNWESDREYLNYTVSYSSGVLTVFMEYGKFTDASGYTWFSNSSQTVTHTMGAISSESTVSILNDTIYIDCEIGEVYAINDGGYTSYNSIVELGSDLPKLSPGDNEITLSNTIDNFQIVPRWWQI